MCAPRRGEAQRMRRCRPAVLARPIGGCSSPFGHQLFEGDDAFGGERTALRRRVGEGHPGQIRLDV